MQGCRCIPALESPGSTCNTHCPSRKTRGNTPSSGCTAYSNPGPNSTHLCPLEVSAPPCTRGRLGQHTCAGPSTPTPRSPGILGGRKGSSNDNTRCPCRRTTGNIRSGCGMLSSNPPPNFSHPSAPWQPPRRLDSRAPRTCALRAFPKPRCQRTPVGPRWSRSGNKRCPGHKSQGKGRGRCKERSNPAPNFAPSHWWPRGSPRHPQRRAFAPQRRWARKPRRGGNSPPPRLRAQP
mmetsp:Transcript_118196/g.294886  ORF Transcript_118196/g.294886 Transcript_118196/m.294886 type:complete len:235 (+) Transcript_118196:1846-2550(+)